MVHLFTVNKTIQSVGYPPLIILSKLSSVTDGIVEFKKYETVGAFQGNQSPYYNWYKKNEKGGFEYWWGFKNLPVCDSNNEKWQEYVYGENGIIDKWFSLGIDGLRLDVVDELSDKFIENVRKAVKRNKQDGLIIGEVWENAVTKEGYGEQRKYLLGKDPES